MNPITHLLVSWAVAEGVAKDDRERRLITFAGVAPDLDGFGAVFDYVSPLVGGPATNLYGAFHHNLFHGVLGAANRHRLDPSPAYASRRCGNRDPASSPGLRSDRLARARSDGHLADSLSRTIFQQTVSIVVSSVASERLAQCDSHRTSARLGLCARHLVGAKRGCVVQRGRRSRIRSGRSTKVASNPSPGLDRR